MDIAPEILDFPCLPPKEEVDNGNYHYEPCPANVNIVLRYPYLHVLFEPGNHLDRFWTRRTLKKLKHTLEYAGDGNPVIGWGVHIVEGPNWSAFIVLTAMFMAASLVLSTVYSILQDDVSSGFAMGSFFLAAETILITLVVTMVILVPWQ